MTLLASTKKEELQEVVTFLNPERFTAIAHPQRRFALGPPGTGKLY